MKQQTLSEWVHEYLIQDEQYLLLSKKEKENTFKVYKAVLEAVSKCLEFDNVYPVLIASNEASKLIILGAIEDLASTIPEAKRITVSLIN